MRNPDRENEYPVRNSRKPLGEWPIASVDIPRRYRSISWPSEGRVSIRSHYFLNKSARAPPPKMPPTLFPTAETYWPKGHRVGRYFQTLGAIAG